MPDRHQPAIAQADRRLHQRYSVQVPIQLQPEGATTPILLETSNLSLYGCNIMMAVQLPVGIRVQATLHLGQHRVVLRGRVLTRHPQFGNGIMFLKFEDDGEQRLRKFLQGL
jgi:PilZ domain